jgi:hypothetical protein
MKLDQQQTALLVAGELFGVAQRLDVAALEKYLENPESDFRYERHCHAAIEFRRALDQIKDK